MEQFRGCPILDQQQFRSAAIEAALSDAGQNTHGLDAVAGRGGLLPPLDSGTYVVNEEMLEEVHLARRGEHASNLGAVLAHSIAQKAGVPAYVVDPVSVDELPEHVRQNVRIVAADCGASGQRYFGLGARKRPHGGRYQFARRRGVLHGARGRRPSHATGESLFRRQVHPATSGRPTFPQWRTVLLSRHQGLGGSGAPHSVRRRSGENRIRSHDLSDWEGNRRDDRCSVRERGRIAVHRRHGTLAAVDEGAQRLYELDRSHNGLPRRGRTAGAYGRCIASVARRRKATISNCRARSQWPRRTIALTSIATRASVPFKRDRS